MKSGYFEAQGLDIVILRKLGVRRFREHLTHALIKTDLTTKVKSGNKGNRGIKKIHQPTSKPLRFKDATYQVSERIGRRRNHLFNPLSKAEHGNRFLVDVGGRGFGD